MSRYRFTIHPFERQDLVSDEALADYAEFGNNLTRDDNKMADNPYWFVSGLSYEDTLKLASADCVENFQRDAQSGETKFWPGSEQVFHHIYRSTDEVSIFAADGTRGLLKDHYRTARAS